MNKDDTKQAIIGFMEFTKGITGNKDLKLPEDIAKEYGIEQEPCKDTISRQAAIEEIEQWVNNGECFMRGDANFLLYARIKGLPSVTPKQRTGHWNWNYDENMLKYAVCSACGWDTEEALEYAIKYFKHCPNCAARMVVPQESEEQG